MGGRGGVVGPVRGEYEFYGSFESSGFEYTLLLHWICGPCRLS